MRPNRRGLILLSVVVAGWALAAFVVGPSLIRAGYAGRGIPALNDVFTGRDTHSVEFYLSAFRRLAARGTLAVVLLAATAYAGVRFPEGRKRWISGILGRGEPLETGVVLWYGAAWGLLGGLAQASYLATRQMVTQRPAAGFFWELLWMAPLASVAATLIVAAVLVGLARLGASKPGLETATFAFAFPAIHGVIQSEGIPFYTFAEVVLSVGLTTAVVRAIAARPGAARTALRRARPPMAAVAVGLAAFAVLRTPSVSESLALRGIGPAEGRPNIVLIILDTVRADHLGLYGYQRETTPRIDEWARSGVVFERAYSTAPWTLPSHATMFTGRYSYELRSSSHAPLDGRYRTLAEVLTDAGYATGGFVANLGYTSEMSGLARGFARYQGHLITVGQTIWSSWLSATLARPLDRYAGLFSAGKIGTHVTTEFVTWLDRPRDRPFFAFLNYFDAHDPYQPPEPFFSRFGGRLGQPWGELVDSWYASQEGNGPVPDLVPWIERYDAGIAYVDHQVGAVLDALEAHGLTERTVVIVTADHGEQWGEHGLIEHTNSVYRPVVHVPLVFSWPGTVPAGLRFGEDATLRDLPATILELAGLGDATVIPGGPLDFSPDAADRAPTDSPRLAELLPPMTEEPWRGLFQGDLQYVSKGKRERLYDLSHRGEEAGVALSDPDDRLLGPFRAALGALAPGS